MAVPGAELADDFARNGVSIGLVVREHVPDGDEQLAGDGDDGDALGLTAQQALETLFPVGVSVDGAPGRFDEDAAEIPTAVLGDVALTVGLAGSVDAGTQTGIPNEVLGCREAGNVADGGQDGERREEGKAGELDDVGELLSPGPGHTEAPQFAIQIPELLGEMVERGDVVPGPDALGGRDVESGPPRAVVLREEIALRWGEVVTMQNAVKAILGCRLLLDQGQTMGEQSTQFADRVRGHPDLGDEVGGQELGQLDSVVLVGFDGCSSDPLDLQGVGDHGASDQGRNDVVAPPGIAGGFEHDGVVGTEVFCGPSREAIQGNAPGGAQAELLLPVHACHDHETLVQIDAQKAPDY